MTATDDLFALLGLERAGFDDVAAVLPVIEPEPQAAPVVMVGGCCSCGAAIDRPLNGLRPPCTHEGTVHPDGSVVVGGRKVKAAGRGRCFTDRHDVAGVPLYSAGNYVPQCAECVSERLGVDASALPPLALPGMVGKLGQGRPAFGGEAAPAVPSQPFKAPNPSRFDGGLFFAAMGDVYTLRRAERGGWEAVALSAGLAGPVHGRTQADAIGAVWEATGAAQDVSAPVVYRREGRDRYGRPEEKADVISDGHGLYLMANPHAGRDPWAVPCTRCGGRGELDSYRHVKGGVCFDCDGDRIAMSYTLEEAAHVVVRMAREAREKRDRRALDAERKRRRWANFRAAQPAAAAWLQAASARGSDFAGKLRARVLGGHELSAGQVQACMDALREEYAAAYDAAHAEAERRERVRRSRAAGAAGEHVSVTGTVTAVRRYTSGPHYRPVARRAVTVDDGEGVTVVVFTSPKDAAGVREGGRVVVSGVVKDPENRDRYSGELQTVLTRAAFTAV
jgi:hypothetical protein